jgi:hypothetical protein
MSAFTVTEQKIIEHTCVLDRCKIEQLFKTAGFPIPHDAKITMTVPGGGDYSDMTLDIEDMPITVKYTTVE